MLVQILLVVEVEMMIPTFHSSLVHSSLTKEETDGSGFQKGGEDGRAKTFFVIRSYSCSECRGHLKGSGMPAIAKHVSITVQTQCQNQSVLREDM